MVDTPVDTEAMLLLFHAPLAFAAIQLAGKEGRHRIPALALGVRAQFVSSVARNALSEGPEFGAAAGVVGAGFPGLQAVPGCADHVCHAF